MNELIEDQIPLEENLKNYNTLYFTTISQGDTLSSSDSTALMEIADLPYFTGGEAIYLAASFLDYEVTPNFPEDRMSQMPNINSNEIPFKKQQWELFPNPSATFFALKGPEIQIKSMKIYDSQMKLLKFLDNTDIGQKIPIDLAPSIYFVNFTTMDNISHHLKLVVSGQ